MVDFIKESPYVEGFEKGTSNRLRQRSEETRLDTAERVEGETVARDAAIRRGLRGVYAPAQPEAMPAAGSGTPAPATAAPQPLRPQATAPASPATAPGPIAVGPTSAPGAPPQTTASPPSAAPRNAGTFQSPAARASGLRGAVARQLAVTPGSGEAAMQLSLGDLDNQQKIMAKAIELAASDPQIAEQFAATNGMPIPDSMKPLLRDRNARLQLEQALKQAHTLYPDTHSAVERWNFIKGRIQQIGQAGPSSELPTDLPKPTNQPFYAPQTVALTGGPDGKQRIGVFDPNKGISDPTNSITDTGVEGFGRGSGRFGAGNPTPLMKNANFLVQQGIAKDLPTAYQMIHSAVPPSPITIRTKALSWLNGQKSASGAPLYNTPEKQSAALRAYEQFANGDSDAALQTLQSLNPQGPVDEGSMIGSLWRSVFGQQQAPSASPVPAAPPASAPPPASRPAAPPASGAGVGTRQNPLQPRTQQDIDNAPPGTVFRGPVSPANPQGLYTK